MEREEIHAFLSHKRVVIWQGEHAGKTGYCYGPYSCYDYEVLLDDTKQIVVLPEGAFWPLDEERPENKDTK